MDSKSQSRVRAEDRISALPDSVLCHILAFLETKSVVRTRVLSTRWKNIWATVPNLVFYHLPHSITANFVAFVNRILFFRDSSSAIQKFHLHFTSCHAEDFIHIDSWIRTAIMCHVVEMYLYVDSYDCELFELPESLFTCKTLKVLTLKSNFITNIPTSGCFPNLKFLRYTVDYQAPKDSSISLPELKTLNVSLTSTCDFREASNFSINAPKLEKLDLMEGVLSNFILENTKSLVKANIHIYFHDDDEQDASANCATKFLAGISSVQYMSLSSHFFQACSPPAFDNLRKLKLILHHCCDGWELLIKLLERSHNLECLVLEHEGHRQPRNLTEQEKKGIRIKLPEDFKLVEFPAEVQWSPPESVPKCLLSSLKSICIMGFKGKGMYGHLDEMEVIKYLLTNGRVLEKMTIYTPGLFMCTTEDFYKEFSLFGWGSKTCEVEIVRKIFYYG
ncbi:F-box/FBD/LRR-repeat protein At1g78750-like [Rosa rugosa]|uniref:F-box/FBD/LRR-repeat protein At1g78750-like n=1 Tax=Rosa rugosa TaxID=74645 RepID=UPI002B4034CF|nr:F-box/FBD/LRR-repeat protein At1g78750-like [Rosa rugosa]